MAAMPTLVGTSVAYAQSPSPVTPPTVVTHVDAEYPRSALADRKHGDVTLALTVDVDGHVSKVDVMESGGADLDEAAEVAAHRWTFAPAMRDGKPVASRIRVPFHFAPPAAPPELVAPTSDATPEVAGHVVPGATEVRVTGRRDVPSRGMSDFRLSKTSLSAAPHGSSADLLATAPGVYIAHPEGETVAPRIYLRGFDAEHGQDVELKVAGIPMNQPSHMHGQGYADLNLVIPETVRSIRVIEGVYDPRQGDFAVAGSAEYDLGVEDRRSRATLTYGSFGTTRALALWAPAGLSPETFGAATFRTTNGFGNGTRGATSGGALGQYKIELPGHLSAVVHMGAYASRSNIAGVLRRDDVNAGVVGLYDAYPAPSARAQSAGSSRAQIAVTMDHDIGDDGAHVEASLWLALASFRARTNFTGYMERSRIEPTWIGRGDLIEQSNADFGIGATASYRSARYVPHKSVVLQYELGTDIRVHRIDQSQKLVAAPQNATWDIRDDAGVGTSDIGLFGDALVGVTKYVRLRGGARADLLFFDVDDRVGNFTPSFSNKTHLPGFQRTASGITAGPRATLESHPTRWLRLSASYGQGYRSPQARQLEEGEQAPFAKVTSYEAGATVRDGERVSLSAIAYQTNLSYDLAFDPSEGRLERIGPTTRRGVVGVLLAQPAAWFNASLSATYVHATLDAPPVATPENPSPAYASGQSLPYVPPLLVRSDVAFTQTIGTLFDKPLAFRMGYGTTFLSPRPLPYGQSSNAVFLVDATVGVRRAGVEVSFDAFNLLGARYADTEYAFVSNWQTSAVPSRIPARHLTAGSPRALLANVTLFL
jgi:TonB family protein